MLHQVHQLVSNSVGPLSDIDIKEGHKVDLEFMGLKNAKPFRKKSEFAQFVLLLQVFQLNCQDLPGFNIKMHETTIPANLPNESGER